MPEGPEIKLASEFINQVCKERPFSGQVRRSLVNKKNPEVEWNRDEYAIEAMSRGKELMLILRNIAKKDDQLSLSFHFGMSGLFELTAVDSVPKHAHLMFTTRCGQFVLSFVDQRRFGHWRVTDAWEASRGPCIITEYEAFKKNVVDHLNEAVFERAICEVMLNQAYFNGIGNYLRAEILHRCSIRPFDPAREVITTSGEQLLSACHSVANEVVQLGSTNYLHLHLERESNAFAAWLQCYENPKMKCIVDRSGRSIWFQGQPGKLVPKNAKQRHTRKRRAANDSKNKDQLKLASEGVEETNKGVKEEMSDEQPEEKRRTRSTRRKPCV